MIWRLKLVVCETIAILEIVEGWSSKRTVSELWYLSFR